MEIPEFEPWPFSRTNISKCLGEAIFQLFFGVKASLWKYILKLKQFALSYSFQYWLFQNSQHGKMNTYYSHI